LKKKKNKTEDLINERKRTSLIASLVHSLQLNEQNKSEEDKKRFK